MEYTSYTYFVLGFFFFGSIAFSLLINSILLRFVKTLGTKNQPGAVLRWSNETKPAIGGLSMFILFLFTFSFGSILFDVNQVFANKTILGLMVSCTLAFMMGLADDAYNTRPLLKFFVQIICGIILIYTGTVISFFENELFNQILTVFWVVAIMNSINMLDNMDAVASLIVAFILLAAMFVLILSGELLNIHFLIFLGLFASIIGFLFYNWHPSRLFMGDTGSQFLGVIIAYIGIKYCWNIDNFSGIDNYWLQLLAVALVFLLPIADTSIVSISRIGRGQSPFVGGKDHTTHNLSQIGLSDSQVAFTIIGISSFSICCFIFLTVYANFLNLTTVFLFAFYILIVFLLLAFITIKNNKRQFKKLKKE